MPSAFGSNYYMKFTLWARGLLSPRFAGSLRPLTTYNHYAPQGLVSLVMHCAPKKASGPSTVDEDRKRVGKWYASFLRSALSFVIRFTWNLLWHIISTLLLLQISFLVSWLWSYSFYHPRSGSVFESFTVTINLIRSAQRPSEWRA